MTVTPSAARTVLQFSMIQCIWCSGAVVSAKVPIGASVPRGRVRARAWVCVWVCECVRTLQEIQQPARSRVARVAILVLQVFEQRNDVHLALRGARTRPVYRMQP